MVLIFTQFFKYHKIFDKQVKSLFFRFDIELKENQPGHASGKKTRLLSDPEPIIMVDYDLAEGVDSCLQDVISDV